MVARKFVRIHLAYYCNFRNESPNKILKRNASKNSNSAENARASKPIIPLVAANTRYGDNPC
jgi:hypothetical protein